MGLPRKVLPTRAKTLQPQNRREKKARRCTHSCQKEFPPNMRPFLLKPVGKKSSGARVSEKIYPKRRFFVKFLATRKSIFFACLSVLPACLSPGGRGRFGRRTGRVKGPPLGVRAFGPCRKADETSPLPDFPLTLTLSRKIMHQLAMLAAKLGGCVNELFCSMCSFFQILGPFPIS